MRGILSGQRHLAEPSTDLIGRELAAGEHDGHTGTGVSTRVKMSQRKGEREEVTWHRQSRGCHNDRKHLWCSDETRGLARDGVTS